MQEEPRWLSGDRARRRKVIKEVRARIRRKKVRKLVEEAVPVLIMLALLVFVILGTRAIDRWLDNLIYEVTPIAEAKEIEQVEVEVVEPEQDIHKVVLATITAYTSSPDETDDTPFETASGATTGHGIIACPPKYEFGTKVLIQGREYTCEDRMNRRYHDQERFDVWVETKSDAYEWGIRKLEVKIATR